MGSEDPINKPNFRSRLHEVPHKPGVYLMKDRLGGIIYVGKAKDLRKRLSSYFVPSRQKLADRKTRALVDSVWDFETRTVRNEPESLILEEKLIKEYRPKYNVSFRDDKRFLLLKIHLKDPWPQLVVTRERKQDGAKYFGPFPDSTALYATMDWLNLKYQLKTCRPLSPSENDYKHCHDDIIKNCSAPCVEKISTGEYQKSAESACRFLEGKEKGSIQEIEEEMISLATDQKFEEAAKLRDVWNHLKTTIEPKRQFLRGKGLPRDPSNQDPMLAVKELGEALGLGTPPELMECFDISNISTTHNVASMVRFRRGRPDNSAYRRYRIKSVKGQDDFASMAEVVKRRYSRILLAAKHHMVDGKEESQEDIFDQLKRLSKNVQEGDGEKKNPFIKLPDLVIVDGGKGQLSSAVSELQRLGLHQLPIVGLAKEREEIFRPGESEPIVLPHDTSALKLMQRIRDEAHRFANSYHQLLLKKRMNESILDDCPGISPKRKQVLLKEFGSLARLRKATHDEITALPGFSDALALGLKDFLLRRK